MSMQFAFRCADEMVGSSSNEYSVNDYVVDVKQGLDASIDAQGDNARTGLEHFKEGDDIFPERKTQDTWMTEDTTWKQHQSTNKVYGLGSGLAFQSEEIGDCYQECWSFDNLPSAQWKQPGRENSAYARLESLEPLLVEDLANLDLNNTARDHPLYHNVDPQADGLYHCPWEKVTTANCQHRPEKLKCNYDKFVDSHLKPYRCKVSSCQDLRFPSTACLCRHEREAHGLHGHGDKPFLGTYEGCERGLAGNGFSRHWNLRDHMKRTHNDSGNADLGRSPNPGASPFGAR
ncbi:hypothetical protein DL95DRAFT_503077 [Leptodontidium sp. 2 PMI_412]|nr:hypothetical protein DL95DRAFT_503077 [Leptodontidium sp. 2 PMI_412]